MAASVAWAQRSARINSISPGIISTPMGQHELAGPAGDQMRAMPQGSPTGSSKYGFAEEGAGTTSTCPCSFFERKPDESGHTHGQQIGRPDRAEPTGALAAGQRPFDQLGPFLTPSIVDPDRSRVVPTAPELDDVVPVPKVPACVAE
jgi:hypothetical protein